MERGPTFRLSAHAYGVNQLRYDLRKLKGHGLLAESVGGRDFRRFIRRRSGDVSHYLRRARRMETPARERPR